jgi:hypothetical protein
MKKKNRSTTLGLSRHGGEELKLAGVALVNGSGGRRKKEVRALYCTRHLVPAGVTVCPMLLINVVNTNDRISRVKPADIGQT